jgi:drug/metabolite transporter (DMT)-like permease
LSAFEHYRFFWCFSCSDEEKHGKSGRVACGIVLRRPALVLAGVAIGWGTVGVMVRWSGLPTVVVVAGRVWLAAATLGVLLLLRRRAGDTAPILPVAPWIAMGSGVLLAVHWLALVAAQKQTPIGTVLLITYVSPVLVALLARPLLGEVVPPRTFAALGLAMIGTIFLVEPWRGASMGRGIALSLLAGVSLAALTLASKRLASTYGGLRLAFVQMVVAGIVVVPAAVGAKWGDPSWSWAWLVVLGIVASGLAAAVYLECLARLPIGTAGVLTYLEPVSAVLFGWWALAESPSARTLVGGALILIAGVTVGRAAARTASVRSARKEPLHVPR